MSIIYRKPTQVVTVKKNGQLSKPRPVSIVGGGQGGLLMSFQQGGNVA